MNKTDDLHYIQYARKSSEAREKQAYSIVDQNLACTETARHSDLDVKVKLEESKSAYKPNNRPQFDRMIALIRNGEVNAILTWKPDRLCRNPQEGGMLLQMLQDGLIKEIRTAQGDIYTPDSDHLILQIHFGMANQFSRKLSQDVKRGLYGKARRGEYPRSALLGYESYGEARQRKMRPHPFEAPLIYKMFVLASEGIYSLGYIQNHVMEKGLRTKKGRKVSKSHIYNILTCTTYYGCFMRNGELFQGEYEPIVSKDLFDAVQAALHIRSKPKLNKWESPYNGLITCPECGCAITTTIKTKKIKGTGKSKQYTYLNCTKRKGKCSQKPVRLEDFESDLTLELEKIRIDEEVWNLGVRLLKAKNESEQSSSISKLGLMQQALVNNQDKLHRLIQMRADGELTKDEFLEQKAMLVNEQARLNGLIKENQDSRKDWLELTENYLNTAFYAKDILSGDNVTAKRDLILTVGKNLTIKNKRLQLSLKEPYDILLKPEYRTNWLGDQDSNLE